MSRRCVALPLRGGRVHLAYVDGLLTVETRAGLIRMLNAMCRRLDVVQSQPAAVTR